MHRAQLVNGAIYGLLGNSIFYITSIILSHKLGEAGFGDYSLIIAIITFMYTLCTLGLEKLALKYIPLYIANKQESMVTNYIAFSIEFIVIAGLILIMLCAGFYHLYTLHIGTESQARAIHIAILFIPIIGVVTFLTSLLNAYDGFLLSTFIQRVMIPLSLLTVVVAAILVVKKFDITTAIILYGLSWLINLIIILKLVKNKAKGILKLFPHFKNQHWLRESLPLMLYSLIMISLSQSGIIFLKLAAHSGRAVGNYAAILSTMNFMLLLMSISNNLYAPLLVKALQNAKTTLFAILKSRMQFMLATSVAFLLIIIFSGKFLLGLFGKDFIAGYPAMCIVAIYIVFGLLFSIYPLITQYTGHYRSFTRSQILFFLANIVLSLLLVPKFNVIGVALALAIPGLFFYLYHYFKIRKYIQAL